MLKRPRMRSLPHVLAVDERRVPMSVNDRNHIILVLVSMAKARNLTIKQIIEDEGNREKFKGLFTLADYNNTQATYIWNRLVNKTLTLEELL